MGIQAWRFYENGSLLDLVETAADAKGGNEEGDRNWSDELVSCAPNLLP